MRYGDDYKKLPVYSKESGKGTEVVPDVYVFTDQIVNVIFIGIPGNDEFIIVDAGMPKRGDKIIEAAKERFGPDAKPSAIILTHGHFDHVGSIIELIEEWQVPVYIHKKELPYVTGRKAYPEPDYKANGGMVVKVSKAFPTDPIDLEDKVSTLPLDGTVPFLPEFRWLPVPGHTEGQVALFRESDRLIIAADAFVTTKQESLYAVFTQKEEVNGPPRYLTPDWDTAKESLRKIVELDPYYGITGHGEPMSGEPLKEGLLHVLNNWEDVAMPNKGKFVDD